MQNILIAASAMKIAVDANTSDVDFLYSRFPRQTIIRRYAFTTGDIYSDEKVKFNWDGTNRQLRFWILAIGSGKYMVGGVQKWAGTALTRVANYISQNVSTYYHYFTAPQTSGAILNSAFNLSGNYTKATYFLTPYNEFAYPVYEITVFVGYSQGYNQFSIKKFSN